MAAFSDSSEPSEILVSVFDDPRPKVRMNSLVEVVTFELSLCDEMPILTFQCLLLPDLLTHSDSSGSCLQYLKDIFQTMHRLIIYLISNSFARLKQGGVKMTGAEL